MGIEVATVTLSLNHHLTLAPPPGHQRPGHNPAPASQPRVSSLSLPKLNPHPVEPPRRLVVAGQMRIFNFEPGHDSGVHRVLLDETLKMVCWAFCERLVSPRQVRRRVVTRSDRDGAA